MSQRVYLSRQLYTTSKEGVVTIKENKNHEAVLVLTLAAAEDLAAELELQASYGRIEVAVK